MDDRHRCQGIAHVVFARHLQRNFTELLQARATGMENSLEAEAATLIGHDFLCFVSGV